jgi:hypothetical protein
VERRDSTPVLALLACMLMPSKSAQAVAKARTPDTKMLIGK